MIRRDYIMTMIEQMARMLAELIFLKKAGKQQEAVELLNHAGRLFFGLDPVMIAWMTDDQFEALLKSGTGEADPARSAVMAMLLAEHADILDGECNEELAGRARVKALIARAALHRSGLKEGLDDRIPSIESLAEKLAEFELPSSARRALMAYYESERMFARAEDELDAMFEAEGATEELVRQGIQFYERLLDQEDAWLIAGNLPRDEVLEALAALRQKAGRPRAIG